MSVEWDSRLKVGIPAVDADHRRMIALINVIQDTIHVDAGQATLAMLLKRLYVRAESHCRREEWWQQRFAGQPRARVRKQHRHFLAELEHLFRCHFLLQARTRLPAAEAEALSRALEAWVMTHIRDDDGDLRTRAHSGLSRMLGQESGHAA